MTKEEIKNYNILCAEFLGYSNPISDTDFYFVENNNRENSVIPNMLELNFEKRFTTDWNWIMELVEAIERLGHTVDIWNNVCVIPHLKKCISESKKKQ